MDPPFWRDTTGDLGTKGPLIPPSRTCPRNARTSTSIYETRILQGGVTSPAVKFLAETGKKQKRQDRHKRTLSQKRSVKAQTPNRHGDAQERFPGERRGSGRTVSPPPALHNRAIAWGCSGNRTCNRRQSRDFQGRKRDGPGGLKIQNCPPGNSGMKTFPTSVHSLSQY